jgi:PAS domain S-box-containing protein
MNRLLPFRLSIRQRLPIFICVLLLSVIFIFGLMSYLGVKKAAMAVGEDRLRSLTQQLGTMLTGNVKSMVSSSYSGSNKQAIKKFIYSQGKDSVNETKNILAELRKDTGYVQLDLLDKDRQNLFSYIRPGIKTFPNPDSLLSSITAKHDSGAVGRLYHIGDSIYFPVVGAIKNNDELVGYLIRWRLVFASRRSLDELSQLMGTDARLYIGNTNGSVWTDMSKPVTPPPINLGTQNNVEEYTRNDNTPVIALSQPITNSNWLIAIEFSKRRVLEAANQFLYWLILIGLVLLVAGVVAGWFISRKISEPLARLTAAASSIASGNYAATAEINRNDELGKLARALHAMVAKLRYSQSELEKKAAKYQLLFEKNPMPMWIISTDTMDVMDVNDAAVNHYGYSREEFLDLNAADLRPAEEREKVLTYTAQDPSMQPGSNIWKHKKKNGTLIMVDVISDDIQYKERPARLILAHDVTEKLKTEAELVKHRILQQQLITETTIQAQEKEREELGKELHDNINQILASTKLYLEVARSGNNDLMPVAISKSYDNVNLAIGEIRQLSKQLVPPSLHTTLVDAVLELVDEIQGVTPIKISFARPVFDESLLESNIKLMLYRIVQEQINNILKHAAATKVAMSLETSRGNVCLVITDNGIGFDSGKKSKGIGLRNIDNRVSFYNGKATITSFPGKGCRLEISIPLGDDSEQVIVNR